MKKLFTSERLRAAQEGALIGFAVALPLGKAPTEITLGLGLLVLLARTLLGYRRSWIPANPANRWLAVWVVLAACSMVNSVDVGTSLRGLLKLTKHLGLLWLVVDTLDNERSMRRVLAGCTIGLALLVGDALWQAVVGKDLIYARPPAWTIDAVKRLTGTYSHPSSLSIYLVGVTPLVIAMALRDRGRWGHAVWGLIALTLVVMVLTRSRAGFLACVGALLLLAWWLRHRLPLVLAVAMIGLQMITLPPAVKAWAASMPSVWEQLTQPDRPLIWRSTLEMVKAHPFLGVGVNTFVQAYPRYAVADDAFGATGTGPYAHNQYLHLAAELGLGALVVLLGLVILAFRAVGRCLSVRRGEPFIGWAAAGLGAGLAGFLFIGCFESSLFYARVSGVFWLLLGWILAGARLSARLQTPA